MIGLEYPAHFLGAVDRNFFLSDDFFEFVTGDVWTSLVADSGTSVAAGDAAGGVVTLGTAATDNNEAALKTTKELFKIAANKQIWGRFRVKHTEANTDDANIFIGFSDAIGANQMVDDGAGVKTSFSGAGLHKADGATRYKFTYSDGSTQTTLDLTAANSKTRAAINISDGSYHWVEILIRANNTNVDVQLRIDGQEVCTLEGLTLANATEMQAGVYVKAGGANAESVLVDAIQFAATR